MSSRLIANKIPAESCRPRIIKGLERQHHPNPPVENQDLFADWQRGRTLRSIRDINQGLVCMPKFFPRSYTRTLKLLSGNRARGSASAEDGGLEEGVPNQRDVRGHRDQPHQPSSLRCCWPSTIALRPMRRLMSNFTESLGRACSLWPDWKQSFQSSCQSLHKGCIAWQHDALRIRDIVPSILQFSQLRQPCRPVGWFHEEHPKRSPNHHRMPACS